jgi:hypothetical protein
MRQRALHGERDWWLDGDTRALIRERFDLAQLVAEYVDVRRAGAGRHVGCCPFHPENTPSFTTYDDGHFHCFGCGAHGDVFDFVMRVRGISFPEAAAELARRAGVSLSPGARRQPLGPTLRQRAAAEREAVFEDLRSLWAERAAITADVTGEPVLEAFAIAHQLPELAAREWDLVMRFSEATMTAKSVPPAGAARVAA